MENKDKPSEGVRSKSYDIEVNKRFFIVIERLIQLGKIKNMFNFCAVHDLLYPNYHRMKKEPNRTPSFYVLNILSEKYGVNADWILTGKGEWLAKK
ncbi:hypothetical protein [Pedobacter rhodius]|uniref:Uncharacterized protein n=1 Tax=Pedobacter rhodius TaxID=3004098 RepID=A0ABT4L1D2_9SPHI|nr:hypothetical protein [Pedobacter sp. SJ11]MCZ4224939.1 hypothetical protein [Pedobacter sp. SJ11]